MILDRSRRCARARRGRPLPGGRRRLRTAASRAATLPGLLVTTCLMLGSASYWS